LASRAGDTSPARSAVTDELALVAGLRDGDEQAFEALVARN
jgi:hypothetical protein